MDFGLSGVGSVAVRSISRQKFVNLEDVSSSRASCSGGRPPVIGYSSLLEQDALCSEEEQPIIGGPPLEQDA